MLFICCLERDIIACTSITYCPARALHHECAITVKIMIEMAHLAADCSNTASSLWLLDTAELKGSRSVSLVEAVRWESGTVFLGLALFGLFAAVSDDFVSTLIDLLLLDLLPGPGCAVLVGLAMLPVVTALVGFLVGI